MVRVATFGPIATVQFRMSLSWLNSVDLARLTRGIWIDPPAPDWRPRALCFEKDWVPGSLVIPKGQPFRHGIDVAQIDPAELATCVLLVTEHVQASSARQLVVPSIDEAVAALAGAARDRYAGTICAVTGSVGKSSTCHLLSHALEQWGTGNRLRPGANTAAGAVAQIVNLDAEHYAVIEMSVGEGLRHASSVVRPHLAVLTAISPAHLTYAGPLPRLAQLKASIFTGLSRDGVAILNRDIPFYDDVQAVARSHTDTLVTYGDHDDADVRLLGFDSKKRRVDADVLGDRVRYCLGTDGRHMAVNSLAVLAALKMMGLDYRKGAARMAETRPLVQRGVSYAASVSGKRVTLIDDSHNANPASMMAAFQLIGSQPVKRKGRRVLVLADMLELGSEETAYHVQLAVPIARAGIDRVHVMGELMAKLWDALPAPLRGQRCETTDELREVIQDDVENGDVILFKGSHSNRLWDVVKTLRGLGT